MTTCSSKVLQGLLTILAGGALSSPLPHLLRITHPSRPPPPPHGFSRTFATLHSSFLPPATPLPPPPPPPTIVISVDLTGHSLYYIAVPPPTPYPHPHCCDQFGLNRTFAMLYCSPPSPRSQPLYTHTHPTVVISVDLTGHSLCYIAVPLPPPPHPTTL